jgi:acyl carrier protein
VLNGALDNDSFLYHQSDYVEPPLSCAQQRLWFLDQFDLGNSVYNLPVVWRIEGRVEAQLLENSINEVIARHEILRTTYALSGEQPVQIIAEKLNLPLEIVELNSDSDFENFVHQKTRETFDLLNGALLRATLIRQNEVEHLLLVFHHSISDGWSVGVFLKELSEFYQGNSLDKLPIQYSDYALWQQNWLKTNDYQNQLKFWTAQLNDAPPLLELATDFPRPSVQRYQGQQLSAFVSPELTDKINQFSRQEGVTPFMTLLSAWQLLMWRYSGQEQIVVGTPIAGRTKTETENLIGFFVNTLPITGDLSGNPSFKELLQRTKEKALGAYANQELPFEKLVEELNPERSLSYSPIFQVMFALQNSSATEEKLGDLKLERIKLPSQTAKFDLSLDVFEETDGLTLWIEYDTDLFAEETIEKMLLQYQNILHALVYQPASRLSEIVEIDVKQREFSSFSTKRIVENECLPLTTPTQKVIAQIWQTLLPQNKIGANSDFFDLGGHSLLALKVIMRLRAHFDLEIPLRKIFEHSTIESLSTKIDQMQLEKEEAELEMLLAELENISEEEAEKLLAEKSESSFYAQIS